MTIFHKDKQSKSWPAVSLNRPKVYLVGKIYKNDWRHELIPSLRNHQWSDGDIDCGHFIYVGPFFVGCDHGCYHGTNGHGAYLDNHNDECNAENPSIFEEVALRCQNGVRRADMVFAYIETMDAIGSMVELGMATELSKPITLCISPVLSRREFRMLAAFGNVELKCNIKPGDLSGLLNTAIDSVSLSNRRV